MFAYKATNTAVDWAPIPATKIGKVGGKASKVANQIWGKITKRELKKTKIPKFRSTQLPEHIQNKFKKYNEHVWKVKYPGQDIRTKAGSKWRNRKDSSGKRQLPAGSKTKPTTHQKFDLHPPGPNGRDGERFVVGKDTNGKVVSIHYTDSHYGKGKSKHGIPDYIKIIHKDKK